MSKFNGLANVPSRHGHPYPLGRTLFTSGQAAGLLGMSQRTITLLMDQGKLRGYRLPSNGRDRRFTRDELVRFIGEHGLPMPAELMAAGVLVFGGAGCPAAEAVALLGGRPVLAPDAFAAGRLAGEAHDAAVIDLGAGRGEGLSVARSFGRSYPEAPVLILATEDEADEGAVSALGSVLRSPHAPEALEAAVKSLLRRAEKARGA